MQRKFDRHVGMPRPACVGRTIQQTQPRNEEANTYTCLCMCLHMYICIYKCRRRYRYLYIYRMYIQIYIDIHRFIDMAVARNRGFSRSPPPPSVTYLCCGPSVTNPCSRTSALSTVVGLSQGGFVARTPDSVTSLVAKRPPGPVTGLMFLRCCHI